MQTSRWITPIAVVALSVLGLAEARAQAVQVENYNVLNYAVDFNLPGTPNLGGLDFNVAMIPNTLDFTPGSVTFEGQPVDFSGTEAAFLATTYTGTAHIPATTGPAIVDIHFDFSASGAFNGPFSMDLLNVQLGPSFAPNFLDIAPGTTLLDAVAPGWSSAVVPELNGFDVFWVGGMAIDNVVPNNTGFDISGAGEILAVPEVLPPAWLLGVLSAAALSLQVRRRRSA